jgi:hypothetical protein
MFGIYDTNSAFLSYCLMKNSSCVHQITSEVPIYKWNKIIVTNELILCSEYQFAEIEAFKQTVVFDTFKLFGPELYYKVSDLYEKPAQKNNKIAFYSTGGWVRKKLGNIDQGVDIEFFEEKFGDYIDRIEVEEKGAHYGSENHSTKKLVLKFYFNDVDDNVAETNYDLMKKVRNDLKNFFNIDLEYYGVPLDLEFYIKTWERM